MNTIRTEDIGILANNGIFVSFLQSSLSVANTDLSAVEKSLRQVIEGGCWCHWVTSNGKEYCHNPADFRRFIESPRPEGCEVKIEVVRKAIRGTDVAETFEAMIRGEPGAQKGEVRNPSGANQHSERINRDTITVNPGDPPVTIPPSSEVPRRRDYSREAPTGTSVSYAVRRLSKARPDLYERVKAGEISAHRGMVLAGFKRRQVAIPIDPGAAARLILQHFTAEEVAELMRLLGTPAAGPGGDA